MEKFVFFSQEKEIEIVNQCTYLDFDFIPSGKKDTGIESFISKYKKAQFSIQKIKKKKQIKNIRYLP